jgi:hypothetical protein
LPLLSIYESAFTLVAVTGLAAAVTLRSQSKPREGSLGHITALSER